MVSNDSLCSCSFFFSSTATTEIYTLSLHDALPISASVSMSAGPPPLYGMCTSFTPVIVLNISPERCEDRKSTRLNSSHSQISYAVFCLKKKKKRNSNYRIGTRQSGNIKTSDGSPCI